MTCPSYSTSVDRLIEELDGIKSKSNSHVLDIGKKNLMKREEVKELLLQ